MKENLFVIATPLQLINAIEAKEYFKTKNNVLIALFTEYESKNRDQIKNLINERYWDKVLHFDLRGKNTKSTFFRQIQLVKSLKTSLYENIFFGDLSSINKLILSNTNKNKTYLLDDGAATIVRYLNDLDETKAKKGKTFRNFRFNLFGLKTKCLDTINLFTSYKLKAKENQEIIFNNLSYFKTKHLKNFEFTNKIFFIGQSVVENNMISKDEYIQYLIKMKKNFSQEIIYIPHRSETFINEIEILVDDKFSISKPSLPVEIEFLTNNIYPKYVYSFFSSALFTLNILFEESEINSIKLNNQSKNTNNVYDYMEKETNINVISL